MQFPIYEIDFLLIIFLFIGLLIGLARGIIPQVVSLVSVWLAMVAALWAYLPFSRNIIKGFLNTLDTNVSDMLAFFILFYVFFQFIRLLVSFLSGSSDEKVREIRKRDEDDPLMYAEPTAIEKYVWGPINALGGMFMGLVLNTLWWAIMLGMLQFILQDALFRGTPIPVGPLGALAAQLKASLLVSVYFNPVLYWLFQSFTLFVPADATIVQFVIDTISIRG